MQSIVSRANQMCRSVLIVEDQMVASLFLTHCVRRLGHKVVGTAITGVEATEKAEAFKPDLIVMDVGLKGDMDGIEAACIINRRRKTPILFVSAYTEREICRHSGLPDVFDYLSKPVDAEQLEKKLDSIFAREYR